MTHSVRFHSVGRVTLANTRAALGELGSFRKVSGEKSSNVEVMPSQEVLSKQAIALPGGSSVGYIPSDFSGIFVGLVH